jgi:competence CoiA-like predicted nuclease
MLTAIRNSDKKKVIGFEIKKDNNEIYFCDYCDEEVIHHHSKSQIKIGHFKHKSHSKCANTQPESEAHILTKRDIREYLQESFPKSFKTLELEKWICNKSIRPDVYLETIKGTKIAIEIQASQLTIDQLINRTNKYFNNNIYVLWVLVWPKSKISNNDFIVRKCYLEGCCDQYCDHSIKLTEMELLLHWMNFKKLIYWNYKRQEHEQFYIVALEKFISEGAEFYSSEGEYQFFDGRTAKNKKIILDIDYEVSFNKLEPRCHSEFAINNKKYSIPARKQLSLIENYNQYWTRKV